MSNQVDIFQLQSKDLSVEKVSELIEERKSFKVIEVSNISAVVSKVEQEIEKKGLRCRVYSEYRSAAMAGIAIPTGVTQVAGLFSAIAIGAHNLATLNPDYEIKKNKVSDSVTVIHMN